MIDELIKEKKYIEALKLINEKDDELSLYQSAFCLYNLNRLDEAKIKAHEALIKANKLYYDIISLLVSILVDLANDDEAIKILEDELTLPYIPYKYATLFNEKYDSLIKKRTQNSKRVSMYSVISNDELSTILINGDNKDVLVNAICELKERNIRIFLPLVKSFLKDESKPRFAKALLLEILVEQGVNEEVEFVSKDEKIVVNPAVLEVIVNDFVYQSFAKAFDNLLLNKNPSLLDYCFEVLTGYLGSIYPLNVEEDEIMLLAGAIHLYVLALSGEDVNENLVAKTYQVDVTLLNKMAEKIAENLNSF